MTVLECAFCHKKVVYAVNIGAYDCCEECIDKAKSSRCMLEQGINGGICDGHAPCIQYNGDGGHCWNLQHKGA